MGFDKRMRTCNNCGKTYIGGYDINFECDCKYKKKDSELVNKEEDSKVFLPKKDIRVYGC